MAERVGVLGFQGCIAPHLRHLERLGAAARTVRSPEELSEVDRLIIPGGESSTMLRFLERDEWGDPLREFAQSKPVWGICAGAILMASEVNNPRQRSFALMDFRATRNFYGSQLESFSASITLQLGTPTAMTVDFIRAPLLEVTPAAEGRIAVLGSFEGHPVLLKQGRMLASSFHPELRPDSSLHRMFVEL